MQIVEVFCNSLLFFLCLLIEIGVFSRLKERLEGIVIVDIVVDKRIGLKTTENSI